MPTFDITLEQMLAAREMRAAKQQTLLARGLPLLCFTLNIAGPRKRGGLIDLCFAEGVRRIRARLTPAYHELCDLPTGLEGYFLADMPAERLKALCVSLEDEDALSRLFDMDVLTPLGDKLTRPTPRTCLLCCAPAPQCARARTHGLAAIEAETLRRIEGFAAGYYADLACAALRAEARATPKPGLVDAANNGAHRDMDLSLLLKSADALQLGFREMYALGAREFDSPAACMSALRNAGLAAERAMLAATGGVNTHKGSLYSMGLLLCAQAHALRFGKSPLDHAAALAQSDLGAQLARAARSPATHGEQVYRAHGATGARGEAAAGFPHACAAARGLRAYRAAGFCENDAACLTLLDAMAVLADTNLLHRGGAAGLAFVQGEAKRLCALPPEARLAQLPALDAAMTGKNLSPGGAADVLALGLFLEKAELI